MRRILLIWLIAPCFVAAGAVKKHDAAAGFASEPIPQLIVDLKDVKAFNAFAPDPIEQALVDRGDAAVEPLLDCLVHDTRPTHAMDFGAEDRFLPGRTRRSPPVVQIAYDALERICKHSFGAPDFGDARPPRGSVEAEGRAKLAEVIRAYWKKYRGVPMPDRCFDTLADDKAGPDEWLQAGDYIVRPRNIRSGFDPDFPYVPGNDSEMRGEPLRSKTQPSVDDLMERRIGEIAALPATGNERNWENAAHLADTLLTWDSGPAVAGWVRKFCGSMVERGPDDKLLRGIAVDRVIPLTMRLIALGDPSIMDDYLRWLREVPPERTISSLIEWFKPLWQHPESAANQEAASYLFTDKRSAWPAFLPQALKNNWLSDVLPTPMLGLRGFRQWTLAALADRSRAGKVTYFKADGRKIRCDEPADSGMPNDDDPFDPKVERKPARVFRLCDYCAEELSAAEGMPRIELDWPEARRDKAVAACAASLRANGDRYAFSKTNPWEGPAYVHPVRMAPSVAKE